MKFTAAALSLAALVGTTVAQLEVVVPGGPDLWWIAQSDNVVQWTCKTSPYTNFTVAIANPDPNVLSGVFPFISQQNNFDCSKLITKDQINLKPGTGYVIQLANPFNLTDVFAQSQPFEIKPIGSAYPASSATPQIGGSATASGSASATGSGSASAPTSSNTAQTGGNNGAGSLAVPGGLSALALAAFGLFFA